MPQIVNKKSVLEMAMGAIAEITDYEVERVVANIMDPNTNATAKRKITITLTFAPDDYRQQIGMDAQAKTTLGAHIPVHHQGAGRIPAAGRDDAAGPRTGKHGRRRSTNARHGPRGPGRVLTQKGQNNGKQLFERRY